ncbi:hypothetical protein [Rhodanobacter sp. C01]|uniref:hypothetical protein n=1 Tax=Rhodanobacter sp. C01 TaxID=1945856 RepID=UPI00098554E0|nr:hypothetical protein [Rhodanobacter sp. C01]OOG48984.1 hypothetical protein B0E50_06085 [Rhodanobacter sp. C01]
MDGLPLLPLRRRIAPTLSLLFLSPLIAEVLSGSTRLRALFVFPIELCVWGGGALLIRHAVRRFNLGVAAMLVLALALAMAEETVIQQSSLAPLVIMLKGEVYARAFGVNYLYLLWALVYESVYVVFVPICLVELIFPGRRDRVWMGKLGVGVTMFFFAIGSLLAWFAWTHVARVKVFHQPAFVPPAATEVVALAIIAALITLAFTTLRGKPIRARHVAPPAARLLAVLGTFWSVLWYGLVVIAFGIAPSLPPAIPMSAGLLIAAAMLYLLPSWITSTGWTPRHAFCLVVASVCGLMAVSFVGFQGPPTADLYFKAVANVLAVVGLGVLGWRLRRERQRAGNRDAGS